MFNENKEDRKAFCNYDDDGYFNGPNTSSFWKWLIFKWAYNVKADNVSITNNNVGIGDHIITLITGDVVKVTNHGDGKSIVSVEPATNNSGGGIRITTIGEDTYVIPNSAMPYLAVIVLTRSYLTLIPWLKMVAMMPIVLPCR